MRKLLFCCCVAAFATAATGAPATAPEVNQSAPNAPGTPLADKPQQTVEKKICRSLEVVFSHRTERVCMTAKQWEEYDRGD